MESAAAAWSRGLYHPIRAFWWSFCLLHLLLEIKAQFTLTKHYIDSTKQGNSWTHVGLKIN